MKASKKSENCIKFRNFLKILVKKIKFTMKILRNLLTNKYRKMPRENLKKKNIWKMIVPSKELFANKRKV